MFDVYLRAPLTIVVGLKILCVCVYMCCIKRDVQLEICPQKQSLLFTITPGIFSCLFLSGKGISGLLT